MLWILINALFPWDLSVAALLRRVKADLARALPEWLSIWHELEALGSLATFAYLNPEAAFPDVLPEAQASAPLLKARRIGHPLIREERRVCNDFEIERTGEVVIITGSNMAGKSSFLRTLGINLCLAYAGGAVQASSLRVGLFRLYSSMRVNDSVSDGISFFYAEVQRLKAILDALESDDPLPLLFLIDEIFRGTNNRERLIGSRAYLRALVGKHGAGVIATHDLELVKLADEFPSILNAHFREDVVDGRMVFDYLLRPGPCPTTNALKVMRLAGLPVD